MFMVRHPNRTRDARSLFALAVCRFLPGLTFGDLAAALRRSRRQHTKPRPCAPGQGRVRA
jgi:hypothetical protein